MREKSVSDLARRSVFAGVVVYSIVLFPLLCALEWQAERVSMLTVLTFAPPQFFILPALALFPACLLFRQWRLSAMLALCVAAVWLGYMHPRFAPGRDSDGALAIVTHNIGQGSRPQFLSFIEAQNPDVVLMQDAKGSAGAFQKLFPRWYVAAKGEFVCASHDLIQKAAIIDEIEWYGRPVMARYEILHRGHTVVLISVHMPTPRRQLSRFLGARAALALLGEEEPGSARLSVGEWNRQRVALYEKVSAYLKEQKGAVIAAGDFNMPDHGLLYYQQASSFRDAFATSGRGYGFTFPGGLGRVAGLIGPWLRIDYVFCVSGCTPLRCAPEAGIKSQHRAVAARIQL